MKTQKIENLMDLSEFFKHKFPRGRLYGIRSNLSLQLENWRKLPNLNDRL